MIRIGQLKAIKWPVLAWMTTCEEGLPWFRLACCEYTHFRVCLLLFFLLFVQQEKNCTSLFYWSMFLHRKLRLKGERRRLLPRPPQIGGIWEHLDSHCSLLYVYIPVCPSYRHTRLCWACSWTRVQCYDIPLHTHISYTVRRQLFRNELHLFRGFQEKKIWPSDLMAVLLSITFHARLIVV